MNLLDRYIFAQFTRNLAMVASALICIYLLIDFFEKIDNFLEAGKSAMMTARYLLLKIPLIIDQLFPVCLLLAGVITLGIMNQDREFMALEAGGISVKRIVAPILVATIFFTALGLMAGEWVVPSTIRETNRIWHEEVNRSKPQGVVRNGMVFYKGARGIYSFRRSPESITRFNQFSYVEWGLDYDLKFQITARTAEWQGGAWKFNNGHFKILSTDSNYKIKNFSSFEMTLPDRPDEFFIPKYKEEESSISDHLISMISAKDQERSAAWQYLNYRLSYLFLGIPLVLLGLPVLLAASRRWHYDLSLAIPISCLLAFITWGWWSASQSMINAYRLSPFLVSWSVHMFAGALGLFMIKKQSDQPL